MLEQYPSPLPFRPYTWHLSLRISPPPTGNQHDGSARPGTGRVVLVVAGVARPRRGVVMVVVVVAAAMVMAPAVVVVMAVLGPHGDDLLVVVVFVGGHSEAHCGCMYLCKVLGFGDESGKHKGKKVGVFSTWGFITPEFPLAAHLGRQNRVLLCLGGLTHVGTNRTLATQRSSRRGGQELGCVQMTTLASEDLRGGGRRQLADPCHG